MFQPHTLPSPSSILHPPLFPLPTTFHTAQSSSANSRTAFKWLQGYEKCRSGWDRFTKPGHSHNGENSSQLITFGGESTKPVGLAFPETWPWSHIITPNSDGTTVIARKELNSCKHESTVSIHCLCAACEAMNQQLAYTVFVQRVRP